MSPLLLDENGLFNWGRKRTDGRIVFLDESGSDQGHCNRRFANAAFAQDVYFDDIVFSPHCRARSADRF